MIDVHGDLRGDLDRLPSEARLAIMMKRLGPVSSGCGGCRRTANPPAPGAWMAWIPDPHLRFRGEGSSSRRVRSFRLCSRHRRCVPTSQDGTIGPSPGPSWEVPTVQADVSRRLPRRLRSRDRRRKSADETNRIRPTRLSDTQDTRLHRRRPRSRRWELDLQGQVVHSREDSGRTDSHLLVDLCGSVQNTLGGGGR